MKNPFVIFLICIPLWSCSNVDNKKRNTETPLSRFSEFSDPIKYSSIVKLGESGDRKSIENLISYYSQPRNPDMRNLLYWSDKQYVYLGPEAYTNYIIAMSEINCDEAWKFLKEKYKNINEFSFLYSSNGMMSIDDKCALSIANM